MKKLTEFELEILKFMNSNPEKWWINSEMCQLISYSDTCKDTKLKDRIAQCFYFLGKDGYIERRKMQATKTNEKENKLTEMGVQMTEKKEEYEVISFDDDDSRDNMTPLEHLDIVRNELIRKGPIQEVNDKIELLNLLCTMYNADIKCKLLEIIEYLKR